MSSFISMKGLVFESALTIIVALFFSCIDTLACQKVFNLAEFGCYADGKSNDVDIFKRVTNLVNKNGGGKIVFEPGKSYYVEIGEDGSSGHTLSVSPDATVFNFRDCKQLEIDLNGATIVMAGNHSSKYAFFRFLNCKGVYLHGGNLHGEAQMHDYSPVCYGNKIENSSHEWGFGVLFDGSVGTIEDMMIFGMTGDGIKTGSITVQGVTYHTKVVISSCEISYCRRNGVTCLSSEGTSIRNCKIHHIGTSEFLKGTAPEAGIDLEYEDGVGDTGNVTIKGCTISDCTQKVISTSNSNPPVPKNLLIEDCRLSGAYFQLANVNAHGKVVVKNCVSDACPINLGKAVVIDCTFNLGASVNYVSGTLFNNCCFTGILTGFTTPYGCCLTGTNENLAQFKRCRFKDIRGLNNESPAYQGFSGFNFILKAQFDNCIFDNCSFVRGNPRFASTFSFRNSTLNSGCMIYNETNSGPISFENCTLKDVASYQTQAGSFTFKKSHIEQTDLAIKHPILLFGTHDMVDCVVIDNVGITSQSRKAGVKSYRLKAVNCKIRFRDDNGAEGVYMTGGIVSGVDKEKFRGEAQSSVRFVSF